MKREDKWFSGFMLAMLLALSACSYIQQNTPEVKSAKDAVAVSYASINAGAQLTTNLLASGTIDANTARSSKSILDRAFGLTEIAERNVLAGQSNDAQAVLRQVNGLISDVQGILGRKF